MKIYKELEQRSAEWFAVRELKMTASNSQTIASNGKGLETYCQNLVCDYLAENITEDNYTNADIERGVRLEPIARLQANQFYGCEFEEVGFVEMDNRTGVSPDGVIFDKDGNIERICELKAPNNKRFVEQVISKEIPKEYIYQIQMQLLVTGAKDCVFLAYNENVKPYVFTKLVTPDVEIQEKIKKGLEAGKKIIDDYLLMYYSSISDESED